MKYAIRPMHIEDVSQVTEIDREAFPTLEPHTPFKRELNNKLARYMIAYDTSIPVDEKNSNDSDNNSRVDKILCGIKHIFTPPTTKQLIAGFVGIWFLVDEAHIITVAVREQLRNKSIGKLLLVAAADIAAENKANFLTLEVRASNVTAQTLYEKFGFIRRGERLGYYTDTKENAIIMTTEPIFNASFKENLDKIKKHLPDGWYDSYTNSQQCSIIRPNMEEK
ncbi:MAG: ribosomal protein S18-alanine N-acetyltransferase [Chloroflexi bacterium]|nr:ribosomal protein S18-alanine N-acetyltransferase [Chloroflexota bacterium]